jgi:hypothetical protein
LSPPPTKIRPPAVTIAPPLLSDPEPVGQLDVLQQEWFRHRGAAFADRRLPGNLSFIQIQRSEWCWAA